MKERELIRKYKTPFYLYDEVILAERTDCPLHLGVTEAGTSGG